MSLNGNWSNLPVAEVPLPSEVTDPNRVCLALRDEAWRKLSMIGCSDHERTLTREQCVWLARISRGRLGSFADEIYSALVLAGFEVLGH